MKQTEESSYQRIQFTAISLLVQLKDVVASLDEIQYGNTLNLLSGSSVGQHTRHILEFFQCFYSMKHSGLINYDLRNRNKDIETNRAVSIAVMNDIIQHLEKTVADKTIQVVFNFSIEEEESIHTISSISRELAYNIEHCTHHMAIIKIGILSMVPNFIFPEHFGIAASTVKHQTASVCVQ